MQKYEVGDYFEVDSNAISPAATTSLNAAALTTQIARLISDRCGVKIETIKLDTMLERDLGITGLDGSELMIEFGIAFKVDMKQFDWSNHFGPEGTWTPLSFVFDLVHYFIHKEFPTSVSDPIDIKRLVDTAIARKWFNYSPSQK